eukprot:8530916-Pyramimonas_sp.AAC.1
MGPPAARPSPPPPRFASWTAGARSSSSLRPLKAAAASLAFPSPATPAPATPAFASAFATSSGSTSSCSGSSLSCDPPEASRTARSSIASGAGP